MCKKLISVLCSIVFLSAFATGIWAATIDITTLLTNPSFEANLGACPTGWACNSTGGGAGTGFWAFAPDSSDYTAGADGLPGSLLVPNGSNAVYSPTAPSGNGTLIQNTTTPYVVGNTYTFTFWVGHPKDAGWPASDIVYLLIDGTTDNLSGNGTGTAAFNVPDPGVGQWKQYSFSYTPIALAGTTHYIGVEFFQGGTSTNGLEVNYDIGTASAPIPEPATMILLGSGLIGLAGYGRKKFFKK